MSLNNISLVGEMRPLRATEDKNMKNENRNEEAVSPVIATILMVAITVVLAGVLYVWASQLAEGNTMVTSRCMTLMSARQEQQWRRQATNGGVPTVYVSLDAVEPELITGQLSSYSWLRKPYQPLLTRSAPTLTRQFRAPSSRCCL